MSGISKKKLEGIELCRGIAAIIVVLYHVFRHLEKTPDHSSLGHIFQFGHAGVDLFFVISGFIILFAHYDDISCPGRIGHYIRRRLTRIMPTYLVALFVTILISSLGGHSFPNYIDIIMSIFLLPSDTEPILGVAWTLQYEVVFYGIFCILLVHRYGGVSVFALWLLWIIWALVEKSFSFGLPASLFGVYNIEFFLGMAIAFWVKNYKMPQFSGTITIMGILLFIISAIAEDLHVLNGYSGIARLMYGVPSALIIFGASDSRQRGNTILLQLLRVFGKSAYSIYLFQFIFIGIVWKMLQFARMDRGMPYGISFLLLSIGGIAGGILMSRYVEYPLIQRVRTWGKLTVPASS
ncbi:MAG: acyltransferase [Desulfocapsaceae bacterium]|nr:acyltransferase [Desulfosporosinus sp.]MDR3629541.1 acyltransferase [Desulfocapsaceae bacterium]